MNVEMTIADYANQQHSQDIVWLLDQYASDPAGGGTGLSEYAKSNVVQALAQLSFAFSILCYCDNTPAGLINCYTLFSTFQCKPVINIHDVVVLPPFRRQGISQRLLGTVEQIARDKGACKITLEVLEKNQAAYNAYRKFGFVGYVLNPEYGRAIFLEKPLLD